MEYLPIIILLTTLLNLRTLKESKALYNLSTTEQAINYILFVIALWSGVMYEDVTKWLIIGIAIGVIWFIIMVIKYIREQVNA